MRMILSMAMIAAMAAVVAINVSDKYTSEVTAIFAHVNEEFEKATK